MNIKIFPLTLTLIITTSLSGMDKNQEKLAASSQMIAGRELIDAASKEDLQKVSKLLQTPGIDVNTTDSCGNSALFIAIWRGNAEIVRLLLDTPGININTHRQETGDTPLIAAAEHGHTEIARLLLNKPGIDINAQSLALPGHAALTWAAIYGHTAVAQLLISKGANINTRGWIARTALMEAARTGHKHIAELLLDQPHINYNARDNSAHTALTLAAESNYIKIVKALLAKRNIDSESLRVACNTALNRGYAEIVGLIHAYRPGETQR